MNKDKDGKFKPRVIKKVKSHKERVKPGLRLDTATSKEDKVLSKIEKQAKGKAVKGSKIKRKKPVVFNVQERHYTFKSKSSDEEQVVTTVSLHDARHQLRVRLNAEDTSDWELFEVQNR